jgi:hypothetical protein
LQADRISGTTLRSSSITSTRGIHRSLLTRRSAQAAAGTRSRDETIVFAIFSNSSRNRTVRQLVA